MQLTSTAFTSGGRLPARHACTGQGVSPPLAWAYLPAGTVSLALIVDDPNAPGGVFAHWVVYDLPPIPARLDEGVGTADGGPPGATQGRNDYGELGYGAACPPRGDAHTYFFRLYALDSRLDLPPGATRAQALAAMRGHILGQTEMQAEYRR
jgi:Raf kinase inhibitor-like YbhB/YbcL family protein